MAKPGEYAIVTDFEGVARAIIRTTSVEIKSFGEIDAQFSWDEGEGDRSLEYWRSTHRAYYERVLASSGEAINDDLRIVCERYETVFTA